MTIIKPPDMSFKQLNVFNFIPLVSEQFKASHWIDGKTHKITQLGGAEWDSPWDFVSSCPQRNGKCKKLQIVFETYKIVPPFCGQCWKVVVRPTTLRELFKLRDLMRDMATKDPEVYCKCGVEARMHVPGIYGGYFYNNGQENGQKRKEQVRREVDQNIGTHVPVILKRYCTEMERDLGDSKDYKHEVWQDDIERFFIEQFDPTPGRAQPAMAKLNTYHNWIKFGWKFGNDVDRAQIEEDYNDGEPLFRLPRKY